MERLNNQPASDSAVSVLHRCNKLSKSQMLLLFPSIGECWTVGEFTSAVDFISYRSLYLMQCGPGTMVLAVYRNLLIGLWVCVVHTEIY